MADGHKTVLEKKKKKNGWGHNRTKIKDYKINAPTPLSKVEKMLLNCKIEFIIIIFNLFQELCSKFKKKKMERDKLQYQV